MQDQQLAEAGVTKNAITGMDVDPPPPPTPPGPAKGCWHPGCALM